MQVGTMLNIIIIIIALGHFNPEPYQYNATLAVKCKVQTSFWDKKFDTINHPKSLYLSRNVEKSKTAYRVSQIGQ